MTNSEHRKKQVATVTNVSLAGEVSRVVELKAVTLRGAKLETCLDEPASIADLEFQQPLFRASFERLPDRNGLRVLIAFSFDVRESVEPKRDVLHLSAEYQALYELPADKDFSSQSLQYFAELNGAVHLWPYWRELVHSVVARVGMGTLTLPVWRVKPAPIAVPAPEEAKRVESKASTE